MNETQRTGVLSRRVVYVGLTDQGEALLQTLVPKVDEIYRQIINSCDQKSWSTMINTLQTIIDTGKKSSDQKQTNNEVYA